MHNNGEKIVSSIIVCIVIALILMITLYFMNTLCLSDCCKRVGGRGVINNTCVDVDGNKLSTDTSCTKKCKFWRW
jgi:hypothetical protein